MQKGALHYTCTATRPKCLNEKESVVLDKTKKVDTSADLKVSAGKEEPVSYPQISLLRINVLRSAVLYILLFITAYCVFILSAALIVIVIIAYDCISRNAPPDRVATLAIVAVVDGLLLIIFRKVLYKIVAYIRLQAFKKLSKRQP